MVLHEDDLVKYELKDGVVFGEFIKKNSIISLELAQRFVETRIRVTNNKPHLFCLRTSNFKYAHKPVRDYMKKEGRKNIIAGAFVVNTPVAVVFFDLFIKMTRVDRLVPTRCFTTENEAIDWLKKHELEKAERLVTKR